MPARKGVRTRKPQKIKKPQRKTAAGKSSKHSQPKKRKASSLGPNLSDLQIIKQLARQERETKEKQAVVGRRRGKQQVIQRAKVALKSFRSKKADRGKLIFISATGKRNPQYRNYNRKGYLVYVTKRGTKKLVKQNKYGYKATAFPNLRLPFDPKYTLARNKILLARRKRSLKKRVLRPRAAGVIIPKSPKHSWAGDVVEKFFEVIESELDKSRGEKTFIISVAIKAREIPQIITVEIDVDGHEFERLSEYESQVEWLDRVFWANISNTLAFYGFVSSGSAAHIKSLKANKGKPMEKWQVEGGGLWDRRHKDIITIEAFEWKIEAVKFHKKK